MSGQVRVLVEQATERGVLLRGCGIERGGLLECACGGRLLAQV